VFGATRGASVQVTIPRGVADAPASRWYEILPLHGRAWNVRGNVIDSVHQNLVLSAAPESAGRAHWPLAAIGMRSQIKRVDA
jgi:hypothetical protein